MNLAVVILTYNEERHIAEAIASARQATDEIIVIDSGSVDNTVSIAKDSGAEVYTRALDDDFAAQRNFAADKTTADYLLHLDADERLSPELAANIRRAVASGGFKLYSFRWHNVLFGKKMRYGQFRPKSFKRLFPREGAVWQGRVHEKLVGGLVEEKLPGELIHYPYDSWEQYLRKFDNYTSIWARQAYEQGKRSSPSGGLLRASFAFVKAAFLQLGLLDGVIGFNLCCWHFMYTWTKYLKLRKLHDSNCPA